MSDRIGVLTRMLELALDNMAKTRPNSLQAAVEYLANLADDMPPADMPGEVAEHLVTAGPNDALLNRLARALHAWDSAPAPKWADETERYSEARRVRALLLLGFAPEVISSVTARIPVFSGEERSVVITQQHSEWYAERRRDIKDFYWDAYRAHLHESSAWTATALDGLSDSVEDVLRRLSDPHLSEIYQVKGLVMGYVQSGKTSHFNGLVAKAVDAGYRLIIVLAGTLDILRRQTQRRIDKDLIGRDLLSEDEYGQDAEWQQFISYGGRPSDHGSVDWDRLTNRQDDYKSLKQLLTILAFNPIDKTKPFNHPDNLRTASAKLAVIKKNSTRINKLADDLEHSPKLRAVLANVPTLIIDDESDQASLNTIDQSKPGKAGKRNPTNAAIARLVALLPRSQYVGYTATPFANVFVNPDDATDLFPKDFVVSLPRPSGYMGVSDFYDFDAQYASGDFRGNRNAFVRPVKGGNEDKENLPRAIDAFVLAGAIKLYRHSQDPMNYRFRHHTMLVHHSASQNVHEADAKTVRDIFSGGARYHRKECIASLERMLLDDFRPVSAIREPNAPFPASFAELKPFVSDCLSRILASGKPVRIVNGQNENKEDIPAFDEMPIWGIVVGGTKLSRGYTVEGLTVSYYRRPTGAGDSLMQMGRWFGFRPGYGDLVRLYVGCEEPRGKQTINLYEAFGAVCRDEEALRADLKKYASNGLTPKNVPPLVRQHATYLPPTSKNRMFNAEIKSRDFSGDWTEKTTAPVERASRDANRKSLDVLLRAASGRISTEISFEPSKGSRSQFPAELSCVEGRDLVTFLRKYEWAHGRKPVHLEWAFIEERIGAGQLAEWIVMMPQLGSGARKAKDGSVRGLTLIDRSRVTPDRIGAYSEPRHREAASHLAGISTASGPNETLRKWRDTSRGCVVIYLVKEQGKAESDYTVGFGIQYPGVKQDRGIVWGVIDESAREAIVVPVPGAAKGRRGKKR